MKSRCELLSLFMVICLSLFSLSFSAVVQAETDDDLSQLYPLGGEKLAGKITTGTGNIQNTDKNGETAKSGMPAKLQKKAGDTAGGSASATETTDTKETEVVSIRQPIAPNNPLNSLEGATFNEELVAAATQESDLAVAMYVLGEANPLALEVRKAANQYGLNVVNAVEQANNRLEYEYSLAGEAGEMFKMGMRNCVLKETDTAAKAGEDEGKKHYPQWACINSRTGAGTGAATTAAATTRVAKSGTSSTFTRASSSSTDLAKLQKCGLSSDYLSAADGANCDGDASGKIGGGTLIGSVRLSYMLFPDSDTSTDQQTLRTEYTETFGDKCYVCSEKGNDGFGNPLPDSAVTLSVIDLPPEKLLADKFEAVHKAVYNNLAQILDKQCNTTAIAGFTGSGNTKKGSEIFRVTGDTGETEATYDDGNFWRSAAALTDDLDSGITIDQAMGYMSFDGFTLTPPIIDAIYQTTVDKGTVPDENVNFTPCQIFSTYKDYDAVKSAIEASAGSKEPIKKQIKNLFVFARAIALGKVFNSCDQILSKVGNVPLMPGMSQAAIGQVLDVCAGDAKNPSGFTTLRLQNLETINRYLDEVYKDIAYNSGKSGAAVASSFKGEKSFSQKGGIQN